MERRKWEVKREEWRATNRAGYWRVSDARGREKEGKQEEV